MTDNISDVVENEPVTANLAQSFHDGLVGEGKKYASDEELARGYKNADLHINELRDELSEERKDKKLLEEVLTELRSPAQKSNGVEKTQDDNASVTTPKTVDVKELVREAMTEEEGLRVAKAKTDTSLELLVKTYGSKENAYAAIRAYIGGDAAKKKLVDNIGNTDPTALHSLITAKTAPVTPSEPNAPGIKDTESANLVLSDSSELVWSKCREIKKKDLKLYNSPEFRRKMEVASAAVTDFYNR